jgi:hypothetical protein
LIHTNEGGSVARGSWPYQGTTTVEILVQVVHGVIAVGTRYWSNIAHGNSVKLAASNTSAGYQEVVCFAGCSNIGIKHLSWKTQRYHSIESCLLWDLSRNKKVRGSPVAWHLGTKKKNNPDHTFQLIIILIMAIIIVIVIKIIIIKIIIIILIIRNVMIVMIIIILKLKTIIIIIIIIAMIIIKINNND